MINVFCLTVNKVRLFTVKRELFEWNAFSYRPRPMAGQNTITLTCDPLEAPVVKGLLSENGFQFADAPHAFWRAKSAGCTATFYNKGKLVLQGADAQMWSNLVSGAADSAQEPVHPFDEALALHPTPAPKCWAGIDETGKGDYFGPLVVVAAAVERHRVPLLRELGVGDSKGIRDARIMEIVADVKACCTYAQVVIRPERYNALYAKIRNLNRLLAWGHARALEDLLEAKPEITWALSDQFAKDPATVERQLMDRARGIQYAQRTKAESDPAVAVASIIARNEFIWQMRSLSKEVGRELPKGAGPPVLAAAREIVANEGRELLSRVAKLHFRTTDQI
jgi:ribonuclease HIII